MRKQKMPYKVCERCGAHLDAAEICDDCKNAPATERATAETARLAPPERAYYGAVVGVDLARGSDFYAMTHIARRRT